MVFAPEGELAGMQREPAMPADFVFVNRIQWGVWSVLGQLQARASWHLFTPGPAEQPASHVVPGEVNAALFADFARKQRFLWLPEGETIGWQDVERWRFPVGAVLGETSYYPLDERDPSAGRRLFETRLLVHESAGAWGAHTHLWNEEQPGATRPNVGASVEVNWIDERGNVREHPYTVQSVAVCQDCHGKGQQMDTLAGRTRQMQRDRDHGAGPENQIDHLASLGFFDADPSPPGCGAQQ